MSKVTLVMFEDQMNVCFPVLGWTLMIKVIYFLLCILCVCGHEGLLIQVCVYVSLCVYVCVQMLTFLHMHAEARVQIEEPFPYFLRQVC